MIAEMPVLHTNEASEDAARPWITGADAIGAVETRLTPEFAAFNSVTIRRACVASQSRSSLQLSARRTEGTERFANTCVTERQTGTVVRKRRSKSRATASASVNGYLGIVTGFDRRS